MNIVILLYDGFTALDVTGPYEILTRLPNAHVQFVARQKRPIESDYKFLKILAEYTIEEIKQADLLLVPGATVSFLDVILDKKLLHWIKGIHEKSLYTLSVSSGSVILAATGILEGKKITSHWYTQRIQKRIVVEDKIITSAGVTAGIDLALFVAEKICGTMFAKTMQLMLEYSPEPAYDSGNPKNAEEEVLQNAQKRLKEDAIRMRRFTMVGL